MRQIHNIIFDLDGTLIDSSEGVVEAVNYSLTQVGEPVQSPEIIKSYIGFPLSTMYPNFTNQPLDVLYSHFQDKAKDTVVQSTVMLPGVQDMLDNLATVGYTLAIASTKIRKHITGVIEKLQWEKYFHSYCGGDEVKIVKPAPDIFKLAMERLQSNTSNSIVVGDTINDIHAAQAISLPVIAVHSPYGNKKEVEESKPDYIIDSIHQLAPLLQKYK